MKIKNLLMLASIMMLSFSSANAQIEWETFGGTIPSNAVIGGVETHRSLPICRCEHKGGIHPGKVVDNACNFGWGGKEIINRDFEILVNKGVTDLTWLKTNGEIPPNAVKGGHENGKPMYIGRKFHRNGTHPGKVFNVGRNAICNVGWGGKEITFKSFEVLVEIEAEHDRKRLKHDNRCTGARKIKPKTVKYIGQMTKGSRINEKQSIISPNMKYQTRVTDDGRLVVEEIRDGSLCDEGVILIFRATEIWSNTQERGDASKDYYLTFQEDGNLCIYSEQSGFVWCSMSNGPDSDHFEITNMGHLEIVNDHGGEVWPD